MQEGEGVSEAEVKRRMKYEQQRRQIIWLSESGIMEFFIFGSSHTTGNAPKSQVSKLARLTGFAELPPYHSFGFHYSKWDKISTPYLHHPLDRFNQYEMPVDTFWLDIEYATDKQYFAFDADRF